MNQGQQLPSTLKFTAHSQKAQKRQYFNMKLDKYTHSLMKTRACGSHSMEG